MVITLLLLVFQVGSEDAFSKFVREISRVSAEHSSAIKASKTEKGKEEITRKNNERMQDLATKAMEQRLSFDYQIKSVDRDSNGGYSVTLEPSESTPKSELVKRRSLTVPVNKEVGESLFTDDLLAFTGKLKTGADDTRSKKALPFAVVRPDGLKLLAIWIDDIEVGESMPDKKQEKAAPSVGLTPKSFVTEIDRVFKDARSEIAMGKTSADKQDSADKHTKIIVDAIEKFDEQDFEFETTIKDVVRAERENEYRVIVSHSDPIKWFSVHNAPLSTVDNLSFPIVGEDRSEFAIGRGVIVRAKISVSRERDASQKNFGLIWINSDFVADGRANVKDQVLVLRLKDISTEFVPEKSSSKPSRK